MPIPIMAALHSFPSDYQDARRRFRSAAQQLGAQVESYPVLPDQDLTIDVAILGNDDHPAMVISSGLHGVEAPYGSAVQLAWLENLAQTSANHLRTILIHVVNPFGYAHDRRWNEDNVDLNRNFFDDAPPTDAPPMYRRLNRFLNPTSLPSKWEPFPLLAAVYVLRYGRYALRQAIAAGQYAYPEGLFYGGKLPCQSTQIVQQHYADWIGRSKSVVHLDLHTGLGKYGHPKLLLPTLQNDDASEWFRNTCGSKHIECADQNTTSYQTFGSFGEWVLNSQPDREIRFATIEVGTYRPLKILSALRDENRVFQYAEHPEQYRWVYDRLCECFVPADPNWRQQAVGKTLSHLRACRESLETSQSASD